MSTKWLGEFDQQLLDEALNKLNRVYEYNYSTSSHDKVSRRLETIMKKIRELKELKIMTNGDLIRKMTDEKLAENISFVDCSKCPLHNTNCGGHCKKKFLEWLKQEAR